MKSHKKTSKTPDKDFFEYSPLVTLRRDPISSKESQNFMGFQAEIEKRYKKSVMNKLYSFPRVTNDDFSLNSSCDSLKSAEIYDLSDQNHKRFSLEKSRKTPKNQNEIGVRSRKELFQQEIAKLNKEIDYYKKLNFEAFPKEDFSVKKPEKSKEKPLYIKLLSLLEENNDYDLRISIGTPSHSRSFINKTPQINRNGRNTDKTPCSFDRSIAKTFKNCCEVRESVENSALRSISQARSKERSQKKHKEKSHEKYTEKSHEKHKEKHEEKSHEKSHGKRVDSTGKSLSKEKEMRVLSPISYSYMNRFFRCVFF